MDTKGMQEAKVPDNFTTTQPYEVQARVDTTTVDCSCVMLVEVWLAIPTALS